MKGYISIEIPVKPYIKAYIVNQLGEVVKLSPGQHALTNKIFDLLEHPTDHHRTIAKCDYKESFKLYISYENFKRRGSHLNRTNVRSFNTFAEKLIKSHFYTIMDTLINILPSFESNLPEARRLLGIDIESWSDDSMRKDYYRYRLNTGKKLLYDKTFGISVPSEKNKDAGF